MASEKTFRDLFLDEVRDLYDAEKQLTKALPKLAKAAASHELRTAIASHLEETRTHVARLETIFGLLGAQVSGRHCAGIAGIIEEANDLLQDDLDDAALDAGIVAAAQRAEHYEISAYGSLIAWAQTLERGDIAETLNETLDDERAADEALSSLAEGGLNDQAAASWREDEHEEAAGDRPISETVGSEGSPSDRRPHR